MTRRDRRERIAETLRESPPPLDDLARARMERRLLDAARERDVAAAMARPSLPGGARPSGRRQLVLGFAFGVAAAAAAFLLVSRPWEETEPVASFDRIAGDGTVARGAIDDGQRVTTAASERVRVRVEESRVEVAPSTHVTFEEITRTALRMRVARGAVDVEFHPRRRGEERMTVETASARIEVVGTRFRVEVDARGGTSVRVSEGTVRVVSRDGGASELVSAGGSTHVPAAAATEPERPPAPEPAPAPDVEAATAPVEPPALEAGEPASEEPVVRDSLYWRQRLDSVRRLSDRGRALALIHALLAEGPPRQVRVELQQLRADFVRRDDPGEAARTSWRAASESLPGSEDRDVNVYATAWETERTGDLTRACAAYRAYLAEFPSGTNARLARARIAALQESGACP